MTFDRNADEEFLARLKRLAEARQEEEDAERGRLGKDAGASRPLLPEPPDRHDPGSLAPQGVT